MGYNGTDYSYMKGNKNPMYKINLKEKRKNDKHKFTCSCFICKSKRGEKIIKIKPIGKLNGMFGRKHKPETIIKLKEAALKDSKNRRERRQKQIIENYGLQLGKYERIILDYIENYLKTPIIRQLPVNGYWIDGYSPIYNIVFEVDEQHHSRQVEKDTQRQNEIKKELNCVFIRIPVIEVINI